jgi:hypothetical protein
VALTAPLDRSPMSFRVGRRTEGAGGFAIRADRQLPYLTLYRVMVTATLAGGSPDFCLVVENDRGRAVVEAMLPSLCGPRAFGGVKPPDVEDLVLGLRITREGSVEISASSVDLPEAALKRLGTTLPSRGGAHDFRRLREVAGRIHRSHPRGHIALISPDPEVTYQDVVWAMDAVRDDPAGPLFPNAVLTLLTK